MAAGGTVPGLVISKSARSRVENARCRADASIMTTTAPVHRNPATGTGPSDPPATVTP
ncbi:hypothetical protein ACU61A_11140 [Pseudonocardia sichuanensis]